MSNFVNGFMVVSDQVQVTLSMPSPSVQFRSMTFSPANGAVYAATAGPILWANGGFGFAADGALVCVDLAGGALPADAVGLNGFYFDADGFLCVDSASAAETFNAGLPFAANGGLCVAGLALPTAITTEGGDALITEGGDAIVTE